MNSQLNKYITIYLGSLSFMNTQKFVPTHRLRNSDLIEIS